MARLAGTKQATSATAGKRMLTATNVNASAAPTPNKRLDIRRCEEDGG